MNIPFTDKKMTSSAGCLMSIVAFLAMGILMVIGQTFYDEVSPYILLLITLVVLVAIAKLGNNANNKYSDEINAYAEKKAALNGIVARWNQTISNFEKEYTNEISPLKYSETKRKKEISDKYYQTYSRCKKGYEHECSVYLEAWKQKYGSLHLQCYWQWAVTIGFIAILGACSFSMGASMKPYEQTSPTAALMDQHSWGADNIPMPHMTNGDLYVSNPDSILSATVEDSINMTLKELDERLGIETAMVIVGHIKNDDPIGLVRGIYEKYKVGRDDRGLVIVVGYLDHSYFIAPGRKLEADITDLETNHLAQQYLIPSMKAEQPDSGMLYLARGVLALMNEKEMPQMSALTSKSSSDDMDSSGMTAFALFTAMMLGWGAYSRRMSQKLGFADMSGTSLRRNPFLFITDSFSDGGSSYSSSHSSGSWGGGSHSSGGYGGGSWGGGGSGGRW